VEVDRAKKIDEILSFAEQYQESNVTRAMYARILGEKQRTAHQDTLQEFKARLPRADNETLDACYSLIK